MQALNVLLKSPTELSWRQARTQACTTPVPVGLLSLLFSSLKEGGGPLGVKGNLNNDPMVVVKMKLERGDLGSAVIASTKTECDYLYSWIKKRSHTKKISQKMVNPRDIAG